MLFSFRVALPDRPGALAQLTALIASHSIDVRAVDVLGGKMTEAVDQLLLDGDSDHVEALADALRDGGIFTLLGIRRAGIVRDDLPELAVVQAVAKDVDTSAPAHHARRAAIARRRLGDRLRDWACRIRQARTPAAPEVQWSGRVPMRSSRVGAGMFTLPDGMRSSLAMAPIPELGVVLIGRNDRRPSTTPRSCGFNN